MEKIVENKMNTKTFQFTRKSQVVEKMLYEILFVLTNPVGAASGVIQILLIVTWSVE